MARGKAEDSSILEYALKALEQERDHLQSKIDEIRRQLGGRKSVASGPAQGAPAGPANGRRKRVLSESARKRIAAAQKRRWAEHRKGQKPAAKKAGAKRAAPAE